MKRFFCTICKKVKHVRVLPRNVVPAEMVSRRTGECRFHDTVQSRKVLNSRVRKPNTYVKGVKSAPAGKGRKK